MAFTRGGGSGERLRCAKFPIHRVHAQMPIFSSPAFSSCPTRYTLPVERCKVAEGFWKTRNRQERRLDPRRTYHGLPRNPPPLSHLWTGDTTLGPAPRHAARELLRPGPVFRRRYHPGAATHSGSALAVRRLRPSLEDVAFEQQKTRLSLQDSRRRDHAPARHGSRKFPPLLKQPRSKPHGYSPNAGPSGRSRRHHFHSIPR